MARIALFSDTWLPNINGVVFSILNQIKVLERDGHEVFLFVPKTHENKMEKIPDITVFEFPGIAFPSYPGYLMSIPRRLKKIAGSQRFDLLHSHSPFNQGWMSLMISRIQKVPRVTTFHTHLAEYAGHLFKGIAEEQVKNAVSGLVWSFIRSQYNKYDLTFTPSIQMKYELIQHGVKQVVDLPNPISELFLNSDNYKDLEKLQLKFKESFKIPKKYKILLYVGRVSFEKRLEVLLEAYRNLEKKFDDIYLVIVGDGPQLGMYKKKAKKLELKNYVFTGYIHHAQLPVIYQIADVFISPSDTETQGLTFIEAMSQGTPVIAVKARGPADFIRHGHNGYFASKLDPKEFETLIENVLSNPEKLAEIKKNAKKKAGEYDYNTFRKRLYSGYKQAIRNWNN